MTEKGLDLQYAYLVVDETPYCIWDIDIKELTAEFIRGVDPTYYDFIADTQLPHLTDNETDITQAQHASLLIRTTYSHALETLFALLCATVQAPHCVPAWLVLYRNKQLAQLVRKISQRKSIVSWVEKNPLSWEFIASHIILGNFILDEKDKEAAVKEGFANFWAGAARDFLDTEFSREYNSIKHGLRVKLGGFSLSYSVGTPKSIPAPEGQMELIGASKFGSTYLVSDTIGDSDTSNKRMKRHYRNWSPTDLALRLRMVAMSISNILTFLRIFNGIESEQLGFFYPTLSVFEDLWKHTKGITVTALQTSVPVFDVGNTLTSSEILAEYQSGHYEGKIRLFSEEDSQNS